MRLLPFLLLAIGLGCGSPPGERVRSGRSYSDMHGPLTTPSAARVSVDDTLTKFDAQAANTLLRYLASNERWEVQEEAGEKYAVRRERVNGCLRTTLGGYYSTSHKDQVYQTRVLLTFGREVGFRKEHGNVTRTKPGTVDVPVVLEHDGLGTPGYASILIVRGPVVGLEIFDESPVIERAFTRKVLEEVGKELAAVLAHHDAIVASGIMPAPTFYPRPLPKVPSFEVSDGTSTGIYELSAFVNPTQPGHVETRVFNTATGRQLSLWGDRSRRYVGWSPDGRCYFPYNAQVMVSEVCSCWYEARFELWHTSNDGTETKLGETTRMINGFDP